MKVKINIIKGDITKIKSDAIVNAANNSLLGGGGVDGAIHKAGGEEIFEQCKKLGGCPTGEARITVAGNLPSNYIIHTVGPIYNKKNKELSKNKLLEAYLNSLRLADEYKIRSIAFPSISTGAYGYPIEEAVEVVKEALKKYQKSYKYIREVTFVLFSNYDYEIYLKSFGFIDNR